jgi:hypothetical protein
MRILVVSPVPTHPRNQGNSARIHALCKGLQALGHLVHFLYYPMEGLDENQRAEMSATWDGFHAIRCEISTGAPPPGTTHRLDDWYDPRLGECARALHERWSFDAVIVNYVWISGVLKSLPDDVCKIVDTHDMFGDRHKIFLEAGLKPEWFYTTPADERRGLARADIVIAIQHLEAGTFRTLLEGLPTRVMTVGHAGPPRHLRVRELTARPVVGYLGSANPFNTSSIRRFAADVAADPALARRFRFVLAGTICSRFQIAPAPFELMGPVPDVTDFYAGVDIVLNPMLGGTGLKIKTLEALSYGLPVLGTTDAWAGIATAEDVWPGMDASSTLPALRAIAREPGLLQSLRERCRRIYRHYLDDELAAIRQLATHVDTFQSERQGAQALPATT